MKRKIINTIIILILLMVASPAFAGIVTYSNPQKFSEQVISVDMVVNDVVYAGFSSKKISSFQPVTDDIDETHIPKFKDSGDSFVTTSFYVYGIVSSPHIVTVSLDFGKNSKVDGTNKGKMNSIDAQGNINVNAAVPTLPVYLKGTDITNPSNGSTHTPNTLPLKIEINPISSTKSNEGTVEPSAVSTRYNCTEMLWLEIPKSELADKLGMAGTYRTELTLTLSVK